jgi:hippurate hydrolase
MSKYLGTALKSPVAFIEQHHEALTAIRRDLHAHPELGLEEHRTAALVAERLRAWGVDEVHTGIGRTGVVGVIRGRRASSGRSIGLRADMDALSICEENDFRHRSLNEGAMHACGHDGHTTMLLGAARYLAETRNFDGTVYAIFQPAEEGRGGARAMLDDGLFERFPADEIYGQHNWPGLPAGHIGLTPGPMMAAADQVEIHITGRGGHGAHPHRTVDPVLIAAHIITAAQSIVSRNVAPIDAAVLSLCAVQAGRMDAFNVIPSDARIIGTARAFNPDMQTQLETRLRELADAIARGFGGQAETTYVRKNPATINHRANYEFALQVARDLVGADRVETDLPPSMGAEDFAFMLQVKPGCYARLGQGGGATAWIHTSRYDFHDAVIPLGAGFLAALAERRMPLANH